MGLSLIHISEPTRPDLIAYAVFCLKRVGDPMLPLKRTALVALLQRFSMTWIRSVLMLYFFMVAHKAACQTLSKAFLKYMKTW